MAFSVSKLQKSAYGMNAPKNIISFVFLCIKEMYEIRL